MFETHWFVDPEDVFLSYHIFKKLIKILESTDDLHKFNRSEKCWGLLRTRNSKFRTFDLTQDWPAHSYWPLRASVNDHRLSMCLLNSTLYSGMLLTDYLTVAQVCRVSNTFIEELTANMSCFLLISKVQVKWWKQRTENKQQRGDWGGHSECVCVGVCLCVLALVHVLENVSGTELDDTLCVGGAHFFFLLKSLSSVTHNSTISTVELFL